MASTRKTRSVADKIIREKDDGDFVDNGPTKRYRCKPRRARFWIHGPRAPVIVIDVDPSLHLSTAIHTGRSGMSPPIYIICICIYTHIQFVRSGPFPGHAMVGRLTPEVVPTRYCLSCISVPSHRLALICELPITSF